MQTSFRSLSQQALGASAATVLTLLLAGCGLGPAGSTAVTSGSSPVSVAPTDVPGGLAGNVHGGQNPVAGATIQLYEVGATGYTSGLAKPLIAANYQTGGVSSVTVTAGGAGYTSNFAVSFSGGGGTGAAGTAVVSNGAVASVTITSAGSGYTSAPTVSFSAGSGTTTAAGMALLAGSGNALTDTNGGFNITGDYSCDAGTYVYIAAYGGNPGNSAVNPNIALIAALGSCSSLKTNAATTSINLNEVTTVAAAYAMAQFTGNSTFGTPLSTQPGSTTTAPADNFTTSSTTGGSQAIANAMALANVLANTASGSSPGNNTNLTASVEWWQIYNIADMLSACINSTGAVTGPTNATPCYTLYNNVNKLGGTTVPADTLQAALALAQSPVVSTANIANLYNGLITSTAPFQPYTSAAASIHDFTVGVAYNPVIPGSTVSTLANTLIYYPENLTFDKYGDAWIAMVPNVATSTTCTTIATAGCDGWILELDPTGNPIPAGSASVGVSSPTVGNYEITTYSLGTTAGATASGTSTTYEGNNISSTYAGGGIPVGMAFDTSNNLWVTDEAGGNVMVVPGSSGAAYTASGTVTTTYNGGNYSGSTTGAYGYVVGATGTYGSGSRPTGLVIDGNNDVFISNASGSYVASATGKSNTSIANTKGLITFVGGNSNFCPTSTPACTLTNTNTSNISGGQYILAIDGGTQAGSTATDTVTLSGTVTAIPGAPFVWSSTTSNAFVEQAFSGTTTVTGGNQGWVTPISSSSPASASATDVGIGSSNAGSAMETTLVTGTSATLVGNGTLIPAVSNDWVTEAIETANEYGMTTDGYGNIWVSSLLNSTTNPTNWADGLDTVLNVVTELVPSYGTNNATSPTPTVSNTFTNTNAAANFKFNVFHDIGSLNSGTSGSYASTVVEARFISSDGGGNVWYSLASSTGGPTAYFGGISKAGAGLSPAYGSTAGIAGFSGAACPTSATCDFTGTTIAYTRAINTKVPAVDLSGNIWLSKQSAPWPNLTVIVGLGVPMAQPASSALSAGNYGRMP